MIGLTMHGGSGAGFNGILVSGRYGGEVLLR